MVFPIAEEYRIILQPEAYEGMESGYAYIEQYSPDKAHQWTVGLMDAINSLKEFPTRCRIAPENAFLPLEIRQLFYGKGKNVYRILFTIQEDVVSILHIRHSAQEPLTPDE